MEEMKFDTGELEARFRRLEEDFAKVTLEKNFLERAMGDLNFHNNAHDGVVYTDAENKIVYANPYFLEMMGIEEEAEIMHKAFPQHMWHDSGQAEQLLDDIHADGFVRERELSLYNREGQPIFAMCSGVVSKTENGEVVGTEIMFCNITSKRKVESELVQQHAMLDAMLQSAPDPVFVFDAELNLERCSPEAEELFNLAELKRDDASFRNIFSRQGMEEQVVEELYAAFDKGDKFDSEFVIGDHHYDLHAAPMQSYLSGWVCVLHDVTEHKQTQEKLQYYAFHDLLTQLPNRAYFIEKLERIVHRARMESDYHFALLFVDLDQLKEVNDSYGHRAGDELLYEFSRRLEQCIRPGDMVCRLGGDEFAVFLDEVSDEASASTVAQRISKSLEEPFTFSDNVQGQATASIGIALSDGSSADLDEMLSDADEAMYAAKESGGNRFRVSKN